MPPPGPVNVLKLSPKLCPVLMGPATVNKANGLALPLATSTIVLPLL